MKHKWGRTFLPLKAPTQSISISALQPCSSPLPGWCVAGATAKLCNSSGSTDMPQSLSRRSRLRGGKWWQGSVTNRCPVNPRNWIWTGVVVRSVSSSPMLNGSLTKDQPWFLLSCLIKSARFLYFFFFLSKRKVFLLCRISWSRASPIRCEWQTTNLMQSAVVIIQPLVIDPAKHITSQMHFHIYYANGLGYCYIRHSEKENHYEWWLRWHIPNVIFLHDSWDIMTREHQRPYLNVVVHQSTQRLANIPKTYYSGLRCDERACHRSLCFAALSSTLSLWSHQCKCRLRSALHFVSFVSRQSCEQPANVKLNESRSARTPPVARHTVSPQLQRPADPTGAIANSTLEQKTPICVL